MNEQKLLPVEFAFIEEKPVPSSSNNWVNMQGRSRSTRMWFWGLGFGVCQYSNWIDLLWRQTKFNDKHKQYCSPRRVWMSCQCPSPGKAFSCADTARLLQQVIDCWIRVVLLCTFLALFQYRHSMSYSLLLMASIWLLTLYQVPDYLIARVMITAVAVQVHLVTIAKRSLCSLHNQSSQWSD